MKNILLVTNDQVLFAGLSSGLNNLGFCVTALADPTAVVNAASADRPDLVIMDFILEELNGGALCHQLKTDPKTQHIPVFLLTGFPGLEKLAVKFGSDALIDKRQSCAELVENVLSLIHDELSIYA